MTGRGFWILRELDDARLEERLKDRSVRLKLAESAYDLLMREGYNPRHGAREMERGGDDD